MQQQIQKRMAALLVGAVLLVGLAGMLWYGHAKQGYHVDELYTYELTNFPGGFYALQPGYMDAWHEGSFYADALTPASRFDYRIPWNNQKIDVHPPLYYCVIHTVSSVFPQWNKWVGLLPNFVFCLAGAVVLYAAARRLLGGTLPAAVAAAAWLWSTGVQGMAIFTRMYSLMMLEALCLLLAHVILWQQVQAGRPGRWVFAGLFAATLAGVLTQYYFLVFCFFWCGCFALYLLYTRRWRTLAAYVGAEFAALAVGYLAFPTMKAHILSGPRGQQAFASFGDISALAEWGTRLRTVFGMLGGQFGGLALWLVLGAAALGVLVWRQRWAQNALFAGMLAVTVVCYCVVISKIAPFASDRYYVICYGYAVLAFVWLFAAVVPQRAHKWLPLLLVPVLAAHLSVGVGYQYPNYLPRNEALQAEGPRPVIVLNHAGYEVAPDELLPEYAASPWVYQDGSGDPVAGLANAVQSCPMPGSPMLVYGYLYPMDELQTLVEQALPGYRVTVVTEMARCPVLRVEAD